MRIHLVTLSLCHLVILPASRILPDVLVDPANIRRMLIIKPSAIGDIVHALPVLVKLRQRFPSAHIAWLVTPPCSGLLVDHPLLDEVILFDRKRFGRSWRSAAAFRDFFRFVGGLRQQHFDLIVDLQGLFRSAGLAWLARGTVRVGPADAREMGWVFYHHKIDTGSIERHAVDRNLTIASALGCGDEAPQFPISISDDDRRTLDGLIPTDAGPLAVLLPGTNWPTKRWPAEHYAALIEPLKSRFGLTAVVAGGPQDAELARQIPGAIDLTGRTTLRQLAALFERASVVVANDSGPMHIAAALGRPLVALFGPTNPNRTGPYARQDTVLRVPMSCSPCYSRRCSHCSCMKNISPAEVLDRVAAVCEVKA